MRKILGALVVMLLAASCGRRDSLNSTDEVTPPSGTTYVPPEPADNARRLGGWYYTNPLPSADSYYGITFWDETLGLAAGDRSVIRTTDGGVHWLPVEGAPLEHIESIQLLSATRAVATGFNMPSSPNAGEWVMTSDDAGTSWTLHPLPVQDRYLVQDLRFDGTNGVVVSERRVFVSLDRGDTWLDRSPSDVTDWLIGAEVRGSNLWVVGGNGLVRYSHDLGLTWETPQTPPEGEPIGIDFANDLVGLASGYNGKIWRTGDGGVNWTLVWADDPAIMVRRVRFLDENTAVAVGFFGTAYWSFDSGLTWATGSAQEPLTWFWSIANVGQRVWVSGLKGCVSYTADSGATWTRQTPGYSNYWRRIAFPDPATGYAVGERGTILKTTDAGETWSAVQAAYAPYVAVNDRLSIYGNSLRGLSFIDANTGWVVGDPVRSDYNTTLSDAIILHTADGGRTWTQQASNVPRSLKAVGFANAQVGYAAGTQTVLRTRDGGQNWQELLPLNGANFTDIAVIDENEVWVSGWQILIHTRDGGDTWTQSNQPFGLLFSVRFVDRQSGWVVGSASDLGLGDAISYTRDGGENWTEVTMDIDGEPQSIAMLPGGLSGVAVFSGGHIMKTEDGGMTWDEDAWLSFTGLSDVRVVGDRFAAVGEFGAALKRYPLGEEPAE